MSDPTNPLFKSRPLTDDEIDALLAERSARNEAHLEALRQRTAGVRSQGRASSRRWDEVNGGLEQKLFETRLRAVMTGRGLPEMESRILSAMGRQPDEAFIPGRGYVSRRELEADDILRYADAVAPSEGHQAVPGETYYSPVYNATSGLAEGILAGLSSDTETSRGFLPELQKGLLGVVDPTLGVDEASRARLYRWRGGEPMSPLAVSAVQSLISPFNKIPGWASVSMRASIPIPAAVKATRGVPAYLETLSGEPVMRLRNAALLPRAVTASP